MQQRRELFRGDRLLRQQARPGRHFGLPANVHGELPGAALRSQRDVDRLPRERGVLEQERERLGPPPDVRDLRRRRKLTRYRDDSARVARDPHDLTAVARTSGIHAERPTKRRVTSLFCRNARH